MALARRKRKVREITWAKRDKVRNLDIFIGWRVICRAELSLVGVVVEKDTG